MINLSMCRICLVEDVRMFSILNTNLQETYEKLTAIPFDTNNGRPLQICYICCARLRNCHQLRMNCLESEQRLTWMLTNNCLKLKPLKYLNAPRIHHPMVCLSCGPVSQEIPDDKVEAVHIKCDVQVKLENVEDTEEIPSEEYIELNNVKTEDFNQEEDLLDYIEETAEETNLCIEDKKDINIETELENIKCENVIKIEVEDEVLLTNDLDKNFRSEVVKMAVKTHSHVDTSLLTSERSELAVHKGTKQVTSTSKLDTVNLKRRTESYTIKEKNVTEKKHIKKPYKCKLCDRSYSHKSTLRSHYGTHNGQKYICDVCDRSFNERNGLKKHIRIHTGENPYKCDICGKGFKQNCNLLSHKLVHTGDKRFKCDVCERRFSHKYALNCHLRIHSGDKPFKCDICHKCFRVSQTLKKHSIIHSCEKPYKCDSCEKCFKFKTHLKQHKRVHKITF